MKEYKSNNEIQLNISHIIILSISYALLGRVALLLAIPPGYATAIFPSSGIAVAALLIWGIKLWPGIFLGSVLLNTWIGYEQANLTHVGLIVAFSAGMGASLQALTGAWLVRKVIDWPLILGKERDIFLFMLLAGPVACLVNASFGSGSLLLTGTIPGDAFFDSWFTWWVGDVFGVWVMAPVMFIAFSHPRKLWLARRNSIAIPVLILLIAVIILFVRMSKWELDREKKEFNELAKTAVYELRNSINNYIDGVVSIERFFVSSSDVTRKDFNNFVSRMLSSKAGMQGVSWNPLVKNNQREKFEAKARKEGFAGFQITERTTEGKIVRAKQRSEYIVVNYIEPVAKNASALGFDVASNKDRLKALNKARDSGLAVATARINLVQHREKKAGFLLFQPVYKGAHSTLAQRRRNLIGYAVGIFSVDKIVNDVLGDVYHKKILLQVTDKSAAVNSHLYGLDNEKQLRNSQFKWDESIDIGGRQWMISIFPKKEYLKTFSQWRAWSIMAAGCFFISMLVAFLLAMTGHSYQVEALVVRRTAELSGILSTAIEAIMTIDEQGMIESVNPATEKLLGFSSEELLGRHISIFIPKFFNFFDYSAANNVSLGNRGDSYAIRKDSSSVDIELAVSTLRLPDRTLYTAIIHDLTEHKKINRMKDEFISTVSHELRTPLTSIKGAMGLVLGGIIDNDSEQKQAMLGIAYQNIERLELLINDLLDFNKFQSEDKLLNKERISINSLIDKALLLNQGYADKFNISFQWHPVEKDDVYINADENKLIQVLNNLFSNAIKYSPEKSPVVLSTSIKDGFVRVSVSDSGPGIPNEFHDRVFERFTQADSSDTRRVGGTGLGLAITKHIIEQHDGTIDFDSVAGQRTTFYFELPIAA